MLVKRPGPVGAELDPGVDIDRVEGDEQALVVRVRGETPDTLPAVRKELGSQFVIVVVGEQRMCEFAVDPAVVENHCLEAGIRAAVDGRIVLLRTVARRSDLAAEVSTSGTLLEAINFSGGATASNYDTTINGVTFSGMVNGVANNGNWADPTATYFSANSDHVIPSNGDRHTSGFAVYAVLLRRFIWDSDAGDDTVTLSGLIAGRVYQVQLFMADEIPALQTELLLWIWGWRMNLRLLRSELTMRMDTPLMARLRRLQRPRYLHRCRNSECINISHSLRLR
jgi:hypothetical protein